MYDYWINGARLRSLVRGDSSAKPVDLGTYANKSQFWLYTRQTTFGANAELRDLWSQFMTAWVDRTAELRRLTTNWHRSRHGETAHLWGEPRTEPEEDDPADWWKRGEPPPF